MGEGGQRPGDDLEAQAWNNACKAHASNFLYEHSQYHSLLGWERPKASGCKALVVPSEVTASESQDTG